MSFLARLEKLEKVAPTTWIPFPDVDAGTLITAVTTNPSYGTIERNVAYYRLDGDTCYLFWNFRQSSAGSNGSGMYLFNLPKGLYVDTDVHPANTGTTSNQTFADAVVGTWQSNNSNGDVSFGNVVVYDSTTFKVEYFFDGGDLIWTSANSGFSLQAHYTLYAEFKIKRTI